jgi:hypothetical protein
MVLAVQAIERRPHRSRGHYLHIRIVLSALREQQRISRLASMPTDIFKLYGKVELLALEHPIAALANVE